ncbi:SymE family type I addiction module toxin [Burkholderia sp. Ac-20379]|uniref:SymE family type I addiction module toxin n=1 Tax=Burkholderia sp. Ac-20379 TaxID=2703900 RepID=UPI00197D95F2|nr:SymE family type I addiction module toxin [Burkholderia sp. Ac-20379]
MAESNHNAAIRYPDRTATIWEHYRHDGKNTTKPEWLEPRTAVPMIRLSGKWIEKAGFEPAHRVRIEVTHGRLVITPIPEAENELEAHGIPTLNRETGLRRRIKPY